MKFEIADEVDAEFVEVQQPEPAPVQQLKQDYRDRDVVDLRTDVSGNPSLELALYQRRGRAISMFVEIPLLTLVAMHEKTPGLVRLGAALLACWKAVELARGGAQEIQTVAEEWGQQ